MALVTMKSILDRASAENYAVGAFNVNNLEFVSAIMSAAAEENSPVIIQVSEGAISYAGIEEIVAMVRAASGKTDVPVALHLDHGKKFEAIVNCIRNGFTSVMIDGSAFPLEQNVAVTAEIVKIAHAVGVTVEGEIGRLGGIEDNVSVDAKDALLTDPDEAKFFVDNTGVDCLAVAIGTSHGPRKFKGEAKLAIGPGGQDKGEGGNPARSAWSVRSSCIYNRARTEIRCTVERLQGSAGREHKAGGCQGNKQGEHRHRYEARLPCHRT